MAAQGNITLNTKVYNPRGKRNGDVTTWQLVGDSSFGGATSTISTSLRGPSREGMFRARIKLDVPKAAGEDSVCGCAGQVLSTAIFDGEVSIPANFTAAERQDLQLRVTQLLASAVAVALMKDLEPAW